MEILEQETPYPRHWGETLGEYVDTSSDEEVLVKDLGPGTYAHAHDIAEISSESDVEQPCADDLPLPSDFLQASVLSNPYMLARLDEVDEEEEDSDIDAPPPPLAVYDSGKPATVASAHSDYEHLRGVDDAASSSSATRDDTHPNTAKNG